MTKKYKIILMMLIVVMLAMSISGCTGGTNYKVVVYRVDPYFEYHSEKVQKYLETSGKKYEVDKTYYAKEIISYTDTSARFIDKEGNEQFISGNKIEINQTD